MAGPGAASTLSGHAAIVPRRSFCSGYSLINDREGTDSIEGGSSSVHALANSAPWLHLQETFPARKVAVEGNGGKPAVFSKVLDMLRIRKRPK